MSTKRAFLSLYTKSEKFSCQDLVSFTQSYLYKWFKLPFFRTVFHSLLLFYFINLFDILAKIIQFFCSKHRIRILYLFPEYTGTSWFRGLDETYAKLTISIGMRNQKIWLSFENTLVRQLKNLNLPNRTESFANNESNE